MAAADQYQPHPQTASRRAHPTSATTNNISNENQQQCHQVDSITHQLQHAGLDASQVLLFQQQQQFEMARQYQFLQQQERNTGSGSQAQAFAAAGVAYMTDSPSGNQREHDVDMAGMLQIAWPQSPRPSCESPSPSARWNFGPSQGSGLAAIEDGGFPDSQASEQVYFAPMDFPLVPATAASTAENKTQTSAARNREAIVRSFDAQPSSQDYLYSKLLQSYRSTNRLGPSGFAAGLGPPPSQSSTQFDASSGELIGGEANFQPVLDSTSLEPLDETSLELLVSSLSQITSDQSMSSSNQMADDSVASSSNYGLSEYLRRSPDLSESFSDSSSISSNSPRGSPDRQDQASLAGTHSRAATAAATGSRDGLVPKKPKRIRRLCTQPNCGKRARSLGLCIAHGGGRRCAVDGCEKSSQGGNMCIKHGGGKRCSVSGCNKAAQTNSLCKAHGGGPRCQVDGCNKSSQGGGFCRSHGGGKRCAADSCDKGTQRGDYCALHGGSRFCEVSGCQRNDRGGGLCAHHGGGKRCGILNCLRPCRRNGFCSTHLRLLGDGDDSA